VQAYADTECTRDSSREAIVDADVNIVSYSCIFSLPQLRLCIVPEWDGKGEYLLIVGSLRYASKSSYFDFLIFLM